MPSFAFLSAVDEHHTIHVDAYVRSWQAIFYFFYHLDILMVFSHLGNFVCLLFERRFNYTNININGYDCAQDHVWRRRGDHRHGDVVSSGRQAQSQSEPKSQPQSQSHESAVAVDIPNRLVCCAYILCFFFFFFFPLALLTFNVFDKIEHF